MMEISTTFRLAHEAGACTHSYKAVAKALGGIKVYGQDTPIPLSRILELQDLNDALWCLRCVLPEQREQVEKLSRLLACDYAERALHLFEKVHPKDKSPRQCIETARRFANGEADRQELAAAYYDACYAAHSAAEREWQSQKFLETVNEPQDL